MIHWVGGRGRHHDEAGPTGDGTAPRRRSERAPLTHQAIARGALGLPIDVPLFAVVGPFERTAGRDAGTDRLWRAWAAVRRRSADAQLLVLADVPVPALPGVRIVGDVPNLAAHLDACDAVFVLARRPGLPAPVADALGRGVSVIVSREAAAGATDAVIVSRDTADGAEAGWVVDGDHPAQIADALLARRMGTAQWLRGATAGVDATPRPQPQATGVSS